jgi:hypothetical protein
LLLAVLLLAAVLLAVLLLAAVLLATLLLAVLLLAALLLVLVCERELVLPAVDLFAFAVLFTLADGDGDRAISPFSPCRVCVDEFADGEPEERGVELSAELVFRWPFLPISSLGADSLSRFLEEDFSLVA